MTRDGWTPAERARARAALAAARELLAGHSGYRPREADYRLMGAELTRALAGALAELERLGAGPPPLQPRGRRRSVARTDEGR